MNIFSPLAHRSMRTDEEGRLNLIHEDLEIFIKCLCLCEQHRIVSTDPHQKPTVGIFLSAHRQRECGPLFDSCSHMIFGFEQDKELRVIHSVNKVSVFSVCISVVLFPAQKSQQSGGLLLVLHWSSEASWLHFTFAYGRPPHFTFEKVFLLKLRSSLCLSVTAGAHL